MEAHEPQFIEYEGRLVTGTVQWWWENRNLPNVKRALKASHKTLMCKHRIALDRDCFKCRMEVTALDCLS